MFLGTFGLQANLVQTRSNPPTHPPTHPGATYPGATHPPTHPPRRHECFWAHSRFRPIWSKPGATHPPNHPPGRHPPGRHPPTHPPTHPGATNVFGHIPASAQFGPNSRNAKNESFLAHSGFSPIWSEQPECQKRIFRGTFGLQPNLVRTARMPKRNVFGHIRASGQFGPNRAPPTHPTTHPRATHPPTRPPGRQECFWAIWSEQPECQKRIFLGTFGLQPNLVRTAGMPKTNVFGHIRASGQFGPNQEQPTHPPTHPPGRHLPGRHPPTHPPTWAPQMFLGTFQLQANLVQTGRHAPTHPPTHPGATNVFGHIPASAQCGPNSRNAKNESFLAHSGFSPIWSEQPECQKRIFWGTFGLQPNLVRTAGMPKRNVFGHIRASGQFGPNQSPPTHPPTHPGATHLGATHPPTNPPGRHECFWAHSRFGPIWSE